MSLRRTEYVAPNPPKGLKGDIFFVFRIENWTFLEQSLLQSFFVRKLSAGSCKAFIGLSGRAQMVDGGFWKKVTYPLPQGRFPVYIRS